MSFTILNFGSGLLTNNGTKNPLLQVLRVISPFRYSQEALMRTSLKDKPLVDLVY